MTAPSLVLSWSMVCPVCQEQSSLSNTSRYSCLVYLFGTIRYLRYRRYLRYGGDKICGADGAAAREPGTIYGTHAAFSYALNRGAMHCAAG